MYLILLAIFRPFCLLRIYRILGGLSRVDFVDVVPGNFLPFSSLPSLPGMSSPGEEKRLDLGFTRIPWSFPPATTPLPSGRPKHGCPRSLPLRFPSSLISLYPIPGEGVNPRTSPLLLQFSHIIDVVEP